MAGRSFYRLKALFARVSLLAVFALLTHSVVAQNAQISGTVFDSASAAPPFD